MKKLVYWGIGRIGKKCMEYFDDKHPQFLIDSHCTDKEYKGIPIYNPRDIKNWNELYIVITIADSALIKEFLTQKKLVEGADFQEFRDFFDIRNEKAEENIERLRNTVKKNRDLRNRTLIFAMPFTIRQSDILINFLRKYANTEKCILVHDLGFISEKKASEQLGFPAFRAAKMSNWNIRDKENCKDDVLEITDLNTEEKTWIESLNCRKHISNETENLINMQQEYQYLKTIIAIFKPRNMIIWGCWAYNSYMLGHICKMSRIPCGYMEHGWIPGTYQFDPIGIAGQSRCAGQLNPEIDFDGLKIKRIKKYIVDNMLDSGEFQFSPSDEEQIRSIDRSKKIVFLVGMDDLGMGINPVSDYWKEFVSSVVSSTGEAFEYIKKICLKHNWNFIFKPHPGNDAYMYEPNDCIFHDIQIDRLIKIADVIVSISSAVNYKTLLYGKPLVQIGTTCLSRKNCCYETASKEQIEENLVAALENGMTNQQIYNFDTHLAMLLDNYLWDDLSERSIRYGLTFDRDFPYL